jgi:glycosyltransferase involved in cell wall biosynthesis
VATGNQARPRPHVTVCVVTYRHEAFLADCVGSVLAQDVDADIHVLIGDDASPDGTPGVVKALESRFPGRITYFRHERNLGPAGNQRFLIERADGDFIAHLDGDDIWLPGKLRAQLRLLESSPRAVASCTNALVFDGDGQPVGFFSNARSGDFDLNDLLRRGNFLNHSSLLYRAEHKGAVLAIPEPFLDYRIHISLCRLGPMAYSAAVLAGYRYNVSTSVIRNTNSVIREQYWEAVQDALPDVSAATRRQACADFLRRVAFRAVRLRDHTLFAQWWHTCREASGASAWRLGASLTYSIAMEALRQTVAGVCRGVLRATPRILYYR